LKLNALIQNLVLVPVKKDGQTISENFNEETHHKEPGEKSKRGRKKKLKIECKPKQNTIEKQRTEYKEKPRNINENSDLKLARKKLKWMKAQRRIRFSKVEQRNSYNVECYADDDNFYGQEDESSYRRTIKQVKLMKRFQSTHQEKYHKMPVTEQAKLVRKRKLMNRKMMLKKSIQETRKLFSMINSVPKNTGGITVETGETQNGGEMSIGTSKSSPDSGAEPVESSVDQTKHFLDSLKTTKNPVEQLFRSKMPENPAFDEAQNEENSSDFDKRLSEALKSPKKSLNYKKSTDDVIQLYQTLPRVDFAQQTSLQPANNSLAASKVAVLKSIDVETVCVPAAPPSENDATQAVDLTIVGLIVSLDKRLLAEKLATSAGQQQQQNQYQQHGFIGQMKHQQQQIPATAMPRSFAMSENAALQMKLLQMHQGYSSWRFIFHVRKTTVIILIDVVSDFFTLKPFLAVYN